MSKIFIVNPGGKPPFKRTKKKTKGAIMAKRRKSRRTSIVRRNPIGMIKPIRRRRNPGKARAVATKLLSGISPKKAVKDALMGQPGMLMAQFFAKKFGKEGKSFFEPNWTWENFAWAIGGAFASGIAGNMIIPGKGQLMVEHGLALVLNKLIQDKMISKNETLRSALGNFGRANMNTLNPPASVAMQRFDMYGNELQGQLVRQSRNMGGPLVPVGTLGSRFTTRTDLGKRGTVKYANAFIKN